MKKKIVPILILIFLITGGINDTLANNAIRGNYSLVGQLPKKNSLKKGKIK